MCLIFTSHRSGKVGSAGSSSFTPVNMDEVSIKVFLLLPFKYTSKLANGFTPRQWVKTGSGASAGGGRAPAGGAGGPGGGAAEGWRN
jgi:hypothetical protein